MPGVVLLDWYAAHARDLPWRKNRDPYRVWVSEIMLQQTRVEAVLPRYEAFLQALPDVEALAAVPEETLFKLWEGLGYYSRARNLQKAARQIVSLGSFPSTAQELIKLSGFGPYTAAAVASIAFSERIAAVDGNVLRIHSRMELSDASVPSPAATKAAGAWALAILPEAADPGVFNQALMDLGATVCTPLSPKCTPCPLRPFCAAFADGLQDAYPKRQIKTSRQEESFPVFLVRQGDRVLVRKRPARGMLAGLWEFPHHLPLVPKGECLCTHRHVFTHRVWNMELYAAETDVLPDGCIFADSQTLLSLAMPSAFAPFRNIALNLIKETE